MSTPHTTRIRPRSAPTPASSSAYSTSACLDSSASDSSHTPTPQFAVSQTPLTTATASHTAPPSALTEDTSTDGDPFSQITGPSTKAHASPLFAHFRFRFCVRSYAERTKRGLDAIPSCVPHGPAFVVRSFNRPRAPIAACMVSEHGGQGGPYPSRDLRPYTSAPPRRCPSLPVCGIEAVVHQICLPEWR